MSDTPAPPRTSGNQPRIFFDGEDATTFLVQHRRMVEACEGTNTTLKTIVMPQLTEHRDQLRENDRKIGILIGDRVDLHHLRKRVERMERRWFVLVVIMVILSLGSATFAGASYLTHR